MNKETLATIIQAFGVASDDPTRYQINGVLIRAEGARVCIVATDGHMLLETHAIDESFALLLGADRFWMHRDIMPTLKLIAKAYKRIGEVQTTREGDTITLTDLGAVRVTFKTDKASDIQFPDISGIKPKHEDPREITFNAEYLYEILKAMRPDNRAVAVTLTLGGNLQPITVRMKDVDGYAVLMPIRA